MARKRQIKKYRRRSGRWSSNIKNIRKTAQFSVTIAEAQQMGTLWFLDLLAENPAQADNAVSQTYTVKNFELSFYIESNNITSTLNALDNFSCYIIFVPQGFSLDENTIKLHPEWILAYRYLGEPKSYQVTQYNIPFKISTRMARRLNTGDQIQFLCIGTREAISTPPTQTQVYKVDLRGLVRWWTKAN